MTTDCGFAEIIHPPDKRPVGDRLAVATNRAVLHFTHVGGGLVAKDGALNGFTIAGPDKKLLPAQAEIQDDTVIVSTEHVPKPAAVRYGWANVPAVNLHNRADLPASPFRTDANP